MDRATAERLALNEARFREVNERLAADVRPLVGPGEPVAFVCECSSTACRETIELPLEQYAEVRADELTFALVPGHEMEDVESVVRREAGYVVVRKRQGEAGTRRAR